MKTRTALLACLTICAMTSPAFATESLTGGFGNLDPYVGASVGLLRYDETGLPTLSPSAVVFRAGLPLSSFFGIEGRFGTGLSSDQTNGNSVNLGTFWGAYAKGSLALLPAFSVYGVAGVASVALHRNFDAGDTTNTGISVGVGGDVRVTPALAVNFEWTYLPSPSQADSNLISVGVNYAF
jgi:opacity protein-like surface antigen